MLSAPSKVAGVTAKQLNDKYEANKAVIAWCVLVINELNQPCCGLDLRFELTAAGAMKSFVQYCAPKLKQNRNEAIATIERSGIGWKCYTNDHHLELAKIKKMKDDVEKGVKMIDPKWEANYSNYGKILQYVYQMCQFSNAIRVLQNGETKKKLNGRDVKIGDYGFDPNRHAQLASGFNLKPMEASSNKNSVGFVTAAIYHIAADSNYKEGWQKAIALHFKGLGIPESQYMDAISSNTQRSKIILANLADLLILIGDRRKHQFGIPLGWFMTYFTREDISDQAKSGISLDITEEKVFDFSFTKAYTMKLINGYKMMGPKESTELVKFLISTAVLNNPYEDLGIIATVVGASYTRKNMGIGETSIFHYMKSKLNKDQLATVSIEFKYFAAARKGHVYADLGLQAGQQVSSEPTFRAKRRRIVEEVISSHNRREGLVNAGDINAIIKLVYEKAAARILQNQITGKATDSSGWYDATTLQEADNGAVETGAYYFNSY